MHVLMVESAGKGGLYAYTDALCSSLAQAGADVTVLTSSFWPDVPRPFKVERRMFKITPKKRHWSQLHWAADRLWRNLGNSLRRNRLAARGRFDVVHMQTTVPLVDQFFLRPLARDLPVVVTVHDVKPHFDRVVSRASFLRRYLHTAGRLIVHHEQGRNQLIDDWGLRSDCIDVIPHGIMPLDNPPTLAEARKKLDLPLDRRLMLFFGSIRTNKGLDILLKALEIARRQEPRILLVVAGALLRESSFEPHSDTIKRCDLSENVRTFIHFIEEDDVDYFFAASDLVVLPYLQFESQSGVLLRAYAHKKPVVVSNVGAMGELVSADNVGLVVEPGDPEALAKAITSALSDLDKFRSGYDSELEGKYSFSRIAELTMHSYEAAVNSKKRL